MTLTNQNCCWYSQLPPLRNDIPPAPVHLHLYFGRWLHWQMVSRYWIGVHHPQALLLRYCLRSLQNPHPRSRYKPRTRSLSIPPISKKNPYRKTILVECPSEIARGAIWFFFFGLLGTVWKIAFIKVSSSLLISKEALYKLTLAVGWLPMMCEQRLLLPDSWRGFRAERACKRMVCARWFFREFRRRLDHSNLSKAWAIWLHLPSIARSLRWVTILSFLLTWIPSRLSLECWARAPTYATSRATSVSDFRPSAKAAS